MPKRRNASGLPASERNGTAPKPTHSKHERAKRVEPRWRKLQRLGQAHLAPGMNLQRWRDLLDLYDIGELLDAPDNRIDGLIAEISEIVNRALEAPTAQVQAKAESEAKAEQRKEPCQ